MIKKIIAFAISASMLLAAAPVFAAGSAAVAIKDVNNHWAQSVIEKAISDGYVTGYADQTFKPNGQVTRVEFAAILNRINNVENAEAPSSGFTDIPAWATTAVNQAVKLGYISKNTYGAKLNPNVAMTRGEMAQWIANGLAKSHPEYKTAMEDLTNTLLPFTDQTTFSQAQTKTFGLVRGTGIITGLTDGSFGAAKSVSRAETVAMIYRYLNAESKEPTVFRALNELREVGTTGTNFLSMGGETLQKTRLDTIVGDSFQLKNSAFSWLKLHKMIVVDTWNKQPTSVYASMFVPVGSNVTMSGEVGVYTIYSLVEYSVNNIATEASLTNNGQPIAGREITDAQAKKYGLPTLYQVKNGQVSTKANFIDVKNRSVWLQRPEYLGMSLTAVNTKGEEVTFRWTSSY